MRVITFFILEIFTDMVSKQILQQFYSELQCMDSYIRAKHKMFPEIRLQTSNIFWPHVISISI